MTEQFEYLAYGQDIKQAKKLIILLHGYGRSAIYMEKVARAIESKVPDAAIIVPQAPDLFITPADPEEFVLNVPQVLLDDETDQSLRRQWFTIESESYVQMAQDMMNIASRMNTFIDDLRDEMGVDDSDIAIMGFSQGGAVALYTAFTRDNPCACVVGHSTIFLDHPMLNTKPPTFFLYGDSDEEFSQDQYHDVIARLQNYIDNDDDFQVRKITGLTHKTNDESREETADYIADIFSNQQTPKKPS